MKKHQTVKLRFPAKTEDKLSNSGFTLPNPKLKQKVNLILLVAIVERQTNIFI